MTESGVRTLRVPARVDDALRALLVLASHEPGRPVKLQAVCAVEHLSHRFLSTVLVALRDSGLVHSLRGSTGGYWLARPADEISVADVFDAVDTRSPQPIPGSQVTGELWEHVENRIRDHLRSITVADLASGRIGVDASPADDLNGNRRSRPGAGTREDFDERCRTA